MTRKAKGGADNMSLKRSRLIALILIVAIATILILARYMPTNVVADTIVRPPTIEVHLANINANMQFIKWVMGIVGGLLSALLFVMFYAYRRDLAHVDRKAEKALQKTDHIEETFMSISTHDRICPKKVVNGTS
jgi:hypothetical protein